MALHHSGSREDAPEQHERCADRVRGVQRFHQDARGWADIAYHLIICRHGSVFAGRPLTARGAHAGTDEGNARFVGVCVLGDYTAPGAKITPQVERGLLRARVLVRQERWLALAVWPHLRFTDTACPGGPLREWCRRFP